MATEVKLTDREIAIAQGKDPDEAVVQETSTVEESTETEASEEQTEESSAPEESSEAFTEPDDHELPEEEEDEEPGTDSWITADVKDLAASYGFSEEDLKDFSTIEEFRRAGRLFDRQFTAARPDEPESAPQGTDAAAKATPPTENSGEKKEEEFELFDPKKLEEDGYEDSVVALGKELRKFQEMYLDTKKNAESGSKEHLKEIEELRAGLNSFQELVQQQQAERDAYELHQAIDGLNEQLFGKMFDENGSPGDLSSDYHKNREKVWEQASILVSGIIRRAEQEGKEPQLPSPKALAQRAYQLAFPDAKAEAKRDQRVDAARRQSKRRRPVGTQAAARPRHNADSNDPVDIANDPRIVEAWKRYEAENGVT